MTTVVSNESYTIRSDALKNRIYLEMQGEVYETTKFVNLATQLRDACRGMKPGFTFVADFKNVTVFALPDIATEVQKTLLEEGVRRVASVWGEQLLAKLALDKAASSAGDAYVDRRKVFTDRYAAETWLNEM